MEQNIYNSLIDISATPAARTGKATIMLERARWAAAIFDRYDYPATMRIVQAVAAAAHAMAGECAERAVRETGFGVAKHKKLKNEMTAHPLVDYYQDQDFVNPRVDEARKVVEIPRPAGVVFALTPSTNPIATLNYKIILSMMTRNAIVFSPHPAAWECSVDAAHRLAAAAVAAGAPDGVIQILAMPTIPMVEACMTSPITNVILATGGIPMVRSAYSSSNPAIGVGPGNAPVFVDSTADLNQAAQRIVESKSFDNSVLCTNESVLITLPDIENQLKLALKSASAYICSAAEVDLIRNFLFHSMGFNIAAIGRDATWIAHECGIRVPKKTKILVAPITKIGVEESLAKEKLCPVLAMYVAKNRAQATQQARAILRLTGAGHSAAIHASDENLIMEFAAQVEAYRVVVNAPCSLGAAGFGTGLAPTFTIGTGFFGRSSIGENVAPQHLVHWTRIAYNESKNVPFGSFHGKSRGFKGALESAPADGIPATPRSCATAADTSAYSSMDTVSKSELRRIIVEELRDIIKK